MSTLDGLRDRRAHIRAATLERIQSDVERHGVAARADDVIPLLDDAAPFVVDGKNIVEVRAWALLALQALDRASGTKRPPRDVLVRKAMPIAELERLASSLASESIAARASEHDDLSASDARHIAMYELLDEAGRIDRTRDRTGDDGLTSLQRALHDADRARPRPVPHLVVEGDEVLGWIYKEGTKLIFDFVASPDGARAREDLQMVLTIQRGSVPRLVTGPDGEPARSPKGSFQFEEAFIPIATGEPRAILETFRAFAKNDYPRSHVVEG